MKFTENNRQNLLTPLMADNFCGVYLKVDKQKFRPLRNEFNLSQTSLRKLTAHPELGELDALIEENSQNWAALAHSLNDVFTHTTRDVELLGWMIAAQIVIDPSLTGAKESILWMQDLVTQQWDSLQPILPDNKIKSDNEDEKNKEINAFKVKAFVQLVGESEESGLLHAPLLMIPLIGDLDYARYQSEAHKGTLADLRSEYHQQSLSERPQIVALIDNLAMMKRSFELIDKKVAEVCKQSLITPIGFKFIISIIGKMLAAIEQISGFKVKVDQKQEASISDEVSDIAPSSETADDGNYVESMNMTTQQAVPEQVSFTSLAQMQACNRDQVFHQLREISDYFRETEPHSPVAYLLEKAIRWGYMPLPELMTELLANQQDSINRVFHLTGLDEQGQITLPEVKSTHYGASSTSYAATAPVNTASVSKASEASIQPQVASTTGNDVLTAEKKVELAPEAEVISPKKVVKTEPKAGTNNALSW